MPRICNFHGTNEYDILELSVLALLELRNILIVVSSCYRSIVGWYQPAILGSLSIVSFYYMFILINLGRRVPCAIHQCVDLLLKRCLGLDGWGLQNTNLTSNARMICFAISCSVVSCSIKVVTLTSSMLLCYQPYCFWHIRSLLSNSLYFLIQSIAPASGNCMRPNPLVLSVLLHWFGTISSPGV